MAAVSRCIQRMKFAKREAEVETGAGFAAYSLVSWQNDDFLKLAPLFEKAVNSRQRCFAP